MNTTEPMTQDQLDAIQERVDAATLGPWSNDYGGNVDQVDPDGARIADNLTQADAEFIAHARQDVPALLADNERLRAENERLRARPIVDDAMVERAVDAYRETFNAWPVKRNLEDADNRRVAAMRAALDAALNPGGDA